jgi:hypothetical protein
MISMAPETEYRHLRATERPLHPGKRGHRVRERVFRP